MNRLIPKANITAVTTQAADITPVAPTIQAVDIIPVVPTIQVVGIIPVVPTIQVVGIIPVVIIIVTPLAEKVALRKRKNGAGRKNSSLYCSW